MKKNIILLLLIRISSIDAVQAQTYISGFINTNTTWTTAGSPYIVNGNALLSNGYTLTIEPGVIVKFDTNRTLQIDGQLIAIGTAQNRIRFTSNSAIPAAGDWDEIHFSNTSTAAVFDSNGSYLSGCIMKYCEVMYGGSSLAYGQIHLEHSSPYFSRCTIMYSSQAGIYANGSTYILDSSMVSNCFQGLVCNVSCSSMTIKNDSIMNNSFGGISVNVIGLSCNYVVQNNYFFGNDIFALNFDNTVNNLTIIGNYFINNICRGSPFGLVHAAGSNIVTTKNYFINDSSVSGNAIAWVYGEVSENVFLNNTSDGIILHVSENANVECNLFRSNIIRQSGSSILNGAVRNCFIRDNLFDGNTSSYNVSVIRLEGVSCTSGCLEYFTNNTFINNSFPVGSCCKFSYFPNQPQSMVIDSNNFINNIVNSVVYCQNLNVQSMKHNNFSNPNSQYELYNNIPYGSPNINADSNYWGSTSSQHLDSVIYDYFDNGALSVVYYSPMLTSSVIIDTSCTTSVPTSIEENNIDKFSSNSYPNPFSSSTTIQFNRELNNADLKIYNIYGQKVKEMHTINSNSINVQRENLTDGIYLYLILEGEKKIANGKLVVN